MQMRQTAALAATAIVMAGTAACGGSSGSTAHTSPVSNRTSDSPAGADATPTAGLADFTDYCGLVDPARLTAIGLDPTKKIATPKGELQDPSCFWATRSTSVTVSGALGMAVHFENGEQQDVSGFQGVATYDDISNVCKVEVQVGRDDLRITIADTGNYTPALKDKGCAPTVDLARQAVDKLKTELKTKK